ncbi:MAG: methyltransferase domain-containing protein, partial [Anaerolineales bacterium]|nr:methyltransferase domain-containing protein [Anaerolineales bacterium]
LEEYERLALKLAQDPSLLAGIKARLLANKETYPLFDTKGFCRSLEEAYAEMYRQSGYEIGMIEVGRKKTKSLDLGCGSQPRNPFQADEVFGIDFREDLKSHKIWCVDLAVEPIPFEDNFFDYVSAYDFLEHIPRVIYIPKRRNAFVELMNEIYRVLKRGGLFVSLTPSYPHGASFQDPTHVNIITEQTFPLYFDNTNRWASSYGFRGSFLIRSQEWHGPHLLTVMQKV